ncbi:hypothetical protein KUTeg_023926 [Tegillarca granosa]|uniref:Uncharacterized protein n=1 Tax=Tegillarca granosa TaxID=220873 RepID=A0ABQ9DWY0_TEGGR|nr:hypothetical protein KUTeg_023926 [Tegillarca granosa]
MNANPEDPKEAAKDVLARAQAKGLLGHRKSKSPKETVSLDHQINGEVSETALVNGHAESDAKLLNKRTRKAPRKIPLRSAVSAQHSTSVPAYSKPHASSPIHNYIHSPASKTSRAKQPNTAKSSFARLYQSRTKSQEDHFRNDDKPKHVAEHLKVVKHPAPFR